MKISRSPYIHISSNNTALELWVSPRLASQYHLIQKIQQQNRSLGDSPLTLLPRGFIFNLIFVYVSVWAASVGSSYSLPLLCRLVSTYKTKQGGNNAYRCCHRYHTLRFISDRSTGCSGLPDFIGDFQLSSGTSRFSSKLALFLQISFILKSNDIRDF